MQSYRTQIPHDIRALRAPDVAIQQPPTPEIKSQVASNYGSRSVTLPAGIITLLAGRNEARKAVKITNVGNTVVHHDSHQGVNTDDDQIPPNFGFIIMEVTSEIWALSPAGSTVTVLEEWY